MFPKGDEGGRGAAYYCHTGFNYSVAGQISFRTDIQELALQASFIDQRIPTRI